MRSEQIISAIFVGSALLTCAIVVFRPKSTPSAVPETAGSKCIARIAQASAARLTARINYLVAHPELVASPPYLLAERREKESYCMQEAACAAIDEPDASQKRLVSDAAFAQCLDEKNSK